jgi:hypothetical protein
MKTNAILGFCILINMAFLTGFLTKFFRLRKTIKRHSYSNGIFREIDEGNKFEFLKLSIFVIINIIVLIYLAYEINY